MKREFLGVYVTPQVRMCDVRIESGFVLSGPTDFLDPEFENRNED